MEEGAHARPSAPRPRGAVADAIDATGATPEQPMEAATTTMAAPTNPTFRVLPQDILDMSEENTACQYCGISYLLLTKVERMEAHCRQLEAQLERRKEYEEQVPLLQHTILELQGNKKLLLDSLSTAQREVQASTTALEAERAAHLAQAQAHTQCQQEREAERTHRLGLQLRQERMLLRAGQARRELVACQDALQELRTQVPTDLAHAARGLLAEAVSTLAAQHVEQARAQQQRTDAHLASKEHESQQLRDAALSATHERERAETEHTTTRTVLQGLEEKYRVALAQLHEDRAQHDAVVAALQGRLTETQAAHATRDTVVEDLQAQLQQTRARAEEAERDADRLARQKADLMHELSDSRAQQDQARTTLQRRVEEQADTLRTQATQLHEAQERLALLDRTKTESSTIVSNLMQSGRQKDELIATLQKDAQQLHASLQGMQRERTLTIDAHQARIKQLQDKFIEDLRAARELAGADKVQALQAQHATALQAREQEITERLQAEFGRTLATLQRGRDEVERRLDALRGSEERALAGRQELEDRVATLTAQVRELKASNAADFDRYQARQRELEERLAQATASAAAAANMGVAPESLPAGEAALLATLAKREKELLFLKETVRIECEERMSLISLVAQMRRDGVAAAAAETTATPGAGTGTATRTGDEARPASADRARVQAVRQEQQQQQATGTGKSASATPAPATAKPAHEQAFEAMIKAAASKKGQKLALGKRRGLFG